MVWTRPVFPRIPIVLLFSLALTWPSLSVAQENEEPEAPEAEPQDDADDTIVDEEPLQADDEEADDTASRLNDPSLAGLDTAKAWTLNASISTRIGQGTFVDPADDSGLPVRCAPFEEDQGDCDGSNAFDRVSNFYGIGASYVLGTFIASANARWSHVLTQGGALASDPERFRFSDISFDVLWLGYTFKSTGTNISTDVGFTLPTSVLSRTASLYTDTFGVISVRQPVLKRFTLIGLLTGVKSWHEFTSPTADINRVGADNALFRANGEEDLGDGLIAIGGRNTEYSLFSTLGAQVFILPGKLIGSASYSYRRFWSYAADVPEDDILRNPFAVGGRGESDLTATSVALTYVPIRQLALTSAISTVQTPKTNDNRSFRFPFWNFEGAAGNNSAITFAARFSY